MQRGRQDGRKGGRKKRSGINIIQLRYFNVHVKRKKNHRFEKCKYNMELKCHRLSKYQECWLLSSSLPGEATNFNSA